MGMGEQFIEWVIFYNNNSTVLFPIVLSFIFVALAIAAVGLAPSYELRTLLILPVAIFFLHISSDMGRFGEDYFLNMSTELLGAFLALLVFTGVVTSQSWTFPLVTTLMIFVIFRMALSAADNHDPFYMNMSTELLGALMTTLLLNREWIWSRKRAWDDLNSDAGDLGTGCYIIVVGENEQDMLDRKERIKRQGLFLTEVSLPASTGDKVFQKFHAYQYTETKEFSYDIETLERDKAIFHITAHKTLMGKINEQMKEVFECYETSEVDAHNNYQRWRFLVSCPDLLSDIMRESIRAQLLEWKQSGTSAQRAAIQPMIAWARKCGFVRKRKR